MGRLDGGFGATRVLLLNPNSSATMTRAMEENARRLADSSGAAVQLHSYTAPSGPRSINDDAGIEASTHAVLGDAELMGRLKSDEPDLDAVLVACFSVHPLVAALGEMLGIPVVGIFEASVGLASGRTPPAMEQPQQRRRPWGIVTTGPFWQDHLTRGVERLGVKDEHFAGVFCSGLTAADFHAASSSPEERESGAGNVVEAKLREATKRLLQNADVGSVVMGCGGMSGMSAVIASTAAQVYGRTRSSSVSVVDPVMAGMARALELVHEQRATVV